MAVERMMIPGKGEGSLRIIVMNGSSMHVIWIMAMWIIAHGLALSCYITSVHTHSTS